VADILTAENPAPAGAAGQVAAQAGAEASRYSSTGEMIKARMPDLVKGAGLAAKGGNTLLTDQADILTRSAQATLDIRAATNQGFADKRGVVKSLNPSFLSQHGYLATALSQPSLGDQLSQVFAAMPGGADAYKSFTAGNLGIGSIYGNTPFNLLAPSRLIYPVYTVN
jgi:hypothetical protein